jgi:hypothetical protein
VSTLLDLIDQGKAQRVFAHLTDTSDDLRAALARYDSLQDDQDKLIAERQIKDGSPLDREWPARWGEEPTERTLLYANLDEAQADMNEAYAELLETIIAILRTEA